MNLTIIIPTFNRNHSVIECTLALDGCNAEVIVVDDGSPQPVLLPEPIRVIRHERNKGRAAALNTGLKAASNDMVLLLDDDVFASPDMVIHLVDEFLMQGNPKLALAGRLVWDPDIPLTMTMRWLEEIGPLREISADRSGPLENLSTSSTVLWRPFVLEHGGFDENFTRAGLEDIELGLRLKPQGLEVRMVASAVGFHHKSVTIRDLVQRELERGRAAVYLHSKFPESIPQADDAAALKKNEAQSEAADTAVEELAMLEQSDSSTLPEGAPELLLAVYRHNFLMGIQEGLREIGGINAEKSNRVSLAAYNEASHLESTGEYDEARRLFNFVLRQPSEEYFAGAEYHLGCIESDLGNPKAAHAHLTECLRLNPGHRQARLLLQKRTPFREVRPNVFERGDVNGPSKVLFILFGAMGDLINAFPTVTGLRGKFRGLEFAWLTLPQYAGLAQASGCDRVRETGPRGVVPWDWIEDQGFTHIFYPETNANQDEWEASGLHAIDFMAQKCGVQLHTRRTRLEPGQDALFQAEAFLKNYGLVAGQFTTASHVGLTSRYWRHSNLMTVAHELDQPMIVFGSSSDPEIPGTISCFGQPFHVVAALIRWSTFYLGPDSGVSWIATTTDTPMGVFIDPQMKKRLNVGFRDVLRGEKDNIEEWEIHTSPDVVISHIQNQRAFAASCHD